MFLLKNAIKGETYVYFAVQKREGKKTRPVRVKSFGKLSELLAKDPDALAHLQEELDRINASPEKSESVVYSSLKERGTDTDCCGNIVLLSEIKRLGLPGIFGGIRTESGFDTARIASDLVCERILDPRSKLASYRKISGNPFYQAGYGINDVYRSLDEIDSFSGGIMRSFAALSRKGRKTAVVSYDTTNFYFEIEREDGLRQYGISKEHRPNPIVQRGLFVDQDGFPVLRNVNPGNTGECKTAVPSQRELSKAGISSYIYCADAGIASMDIKIHNSVCGRRYVVAQPVKKLDCLRKQWALSDTGWHLGSKRVDSVADCPEDGYLWKEELYAVDGRKDGKKVRIPERLVVIYSAGSARWQEGILEEQLRRAAKKAEKGIGANPNSPDRLVSVRKCTDEGEAAENEVRSVDRDKAEDERRYHGFYAIATNILASDGVSAKDVIAINAGRWVVERFFRERKTTCDTRPIYLASDGRIRSHLFLCRLSVYVLRNRKAELEGMGIKASCGDIAVALKTMYATKQKLGYVLGSEDRGGLKEIRRGLLKANGLEMLAAQYLPEGKRKKILKELRA